MSVEKDEISLIYNQIKEWVDKTKKPTTANIIVLVTLLIKCVEKIAGDKDGSYKKDLVLKVITKVVKESELQEEEKNIIMMFVENSVPIMIDTMIGIAKNNIDLGKVKKSLMSCMCF